MNHYALASIERMRVRACVSACARLHSLARPCVYFIFLAILSKASKHEWQLIALLVWYSCWLLCYKQKKKTRQQNSTNNMFYTKFHIIFVLSLSSVVVIMYRIIQWEMHSTTGETENNSERKKKSKHILKYTASQIYRWKILIDDT